MITQELTAYVKSELNKGKTREEIRNSLLSGGGWSDSDISEVFRTVIPLETINPVLPKATPFNPNGPINVIPPTPPTAQNAPTTPKPLVFEVASPVSNIEKTKSASKFPFVSVILAMLIGVFCFVIFYFFRPQVMILPTQIKNSFNSLVDKISGAKEEIPIVVVEEIPVAPVIPEVVIPQKINCGITDSPDRKKPNAYMNDIVLKCLGESLKTCVDTEGEINDPLFPSVFKISTNQTNGACNFSLNYKADSLLADAKGQKLAGSGITCPVSVVKTVDETNPTKPVFKSPDTSNSNKFAVDTYFYLTFGIFVENNLDQTKIEALGCEGLFIKYMVDSLKQVKPKR